MHSNLQLSIFWPMQGSFWNVLRQSVIPTVNLAHSIRNAVDSQPLEKNYLKVEQTAHPIKIVQIYILAEIVCTNRQIYFFINVFGWNFDFPKTVFDNLASLFIISYSKNPQNHQIVMEFWWNLSSVLNHRKMPLKTNILRSAIVYGQ